MDDLTFLNELRAEAEGHPKEMALRLRLLAAAAIILWTLVVWASYLWFRENEMHHLEETAFNHALSLVEKDLLYRKWVALQGGVYAPVSENLPPNPYLHEPERDIETPSGKQLTLVNPAFMTRMVHALGLEKGACPSHLTSLRPTHPANAADAWERKALEWLEKHPEEAHYRELVPDPGGQTLKVMVPLRLEAPCLRCHNDPQAALGAIRGGIRVSVPLERFAASHRVQRQDVLQSHLTIWLLGLLGIGAASFWGYRRVREREELFQGITRKERFWKSLVESLQDPLIVLNGDLRVRLINPAAAALADVKPHEALGRSCREVFSRWHALSGACTTQACGAQETQKTGQTCSRQMEIQLGDGSRRVFHVLVSPVKDEDGNIVSVIESFRDITREADARRELTEHNRELELLFDHMFGGFALHEILTDDRGTPVDYRFLKVNRAFEDLTGLKAEAILGKTLREVLPEAQGDWVERYGRTALSGVPQQFEAFEPSLGRYFSVRAYQPEPGKFVTLFFDVTARKKAEEVLRKSEVFFRELFEKSAEPQLLVDPSSTRILDANEAAERLYGWSRQELKGKLYREVSLHPPDLISQRLALSAKEAGAVYLARHRTACGEEKAVEVAAGPVTLNGEPHVLCFIHDVTERERLQEQLRHAQKMQAVGQLAGGVAHEFNNILQVMNGFVEMVLSETPRDSPNGERLRKVLDSGRKAARLVQQLLAFSRKQILRPKPTDMNELLGEFIKLARKMVGETIRVHLAPAGELPRVKVDPQLMEQVFLNLVVNARDAMPEGGEILFETAPVVLDEDYVKKHPHAKPGPYVMVSVTDTGCGMTPEVMERIFEPFFTTKEVGKGTGLGLSVAFGIVKQHDGLIHVYSEPGRGTTFRIYLKAAEEAEAASVQDLSEEDAPRGTETILLAEDDRAVREYLATVLREAGYRVLEAKSGLEAVELFATTPESVDLLVFDVVMPGMGGEEALGLIRQKGWRIPAVFLSGYTGRTHGLSKTSTSDTVFLEKPLRRPALLQAVRSLLDRRSKGPAFSHSPYDV